MNWRGIFGIYAGFAVVFGGGWLWMRGGATWTLGIVALGVAVALASVVQIVLARRGPRPAKAPKVAKLSKANAAAAAVADADDMDAAVRARMAAIAGRSSGRSAVEVPAAEVEVEAAVEDFLVEPVQPEAAEIEHVVEDVAISPESDEHEVLKEEPAEPVAEDGSHSWNDLAPAAAETECQEEAAPTEVEAALDGDESDALPIETVAAEIEPDDVDTDGSVLEPVAAIEIEEPAPVPVETESEAVAEPLLSLDRQPGFPWTARYIALWAQEVRDSSPEPFRDAVAHWQRWAVQQNAGTPLIEEAGEEFRAMIAVWREEVGEVPELTARDWPVRQLYREAEEDEALAALLPVLERETVG
jgi:hypothetical protein